MSNVTVSASVPYAMKLDIKAVCDALTDNEPGKVSMTSFIRWCLKEGLRIKRAELEEKGWIEKMHSTEYYE